MLLRLAGLANHGNVPCVTIANLTQGIVFGLRGVLFVRQEQSHGCAVKRKSPRRRERDGYGVAGVMRTLERAQSALRHDRAANLLLAGVAIASDSAFDFFGGELRDEQFFFRHGGQQHSARVTHDDGGLRVLDMAEQRFNSGVIRL